MRRVRVSAPAHVHLGNFDLCGDLGRLFGTVGFVLDEPRVEIVVEKAQAVSAEGPYADLACEVARKVVSMLNVDPVKIRIVRAFRRGVGLGLTTALYLSVAWGIARLYDVDVNLLDVARRLGRGIVSALGTYGFMYGGMIIDAGYRLDKFGIEIPPLIARLEIPESWTFLVAVPKTVPERVIKIKEREAEILSNLPKMSSELSGRLCRLVLMALIPSVIEHDIETFGKAVTEFNRLAGTYWSPFQDGKIYCSDEVEKGIEILLKNGAVGAAQSCWGPTFYGIFKDRDTAIDAARILTTSISCDVYITKVSNRGAIATVE